MDFTATVAGSTDSAAPRKGAYVVGLGLGPPYGCGLCGPRSARPWAAGRGNICSSSMVGEGLGVVKAGVARRAGGEGESQTLPYGRERARHEAVGGSRDSQQGAHGVRKDLVW